MLRGGGNDSERTLVDWQVSILVRFVDPDGSVTEPLVLESEAF